MTMANGMHQQVKLEPDAFKLFIGQVPKSWEEKDLTPIFAEYGDIFDLSILKDKFSGQHKGCAFLTYYSRESALKAQANLHENRTLPGMHHPMQVKPADSETKSEERKLFVGMISKNSTEEDLRVKFSPYGAIEELTVLRNPDGTSKGCAFVKFSTRLQAQSAIRAMHNNSTMEGCSSPVVVKTADTDKDKMQKRMQSMASNMFGLAAMQIAYNPYQQLLQQAAANGTIPGYSPVGMQGLTPPGHDNSGMQGTMGALVAAMANQQQQHAHQPPPTLYTPGAVTQPQSIAPALPSTPASSVASLGGLPGMQGMQGLTTSALANAQLGMNPLAGMAGLGGMNAAFPATAYTQYVQQQAVRQQQKEGPEGANLFIYHLPPEFSDADLMQTFLPFGNVLSAKVFIDKSTNLSKCFGFVSFDAQQSAHQAIQAMNGFQIGTKRLKVQLKRPKDANRPY